MNRLLERHHWIGLGLVAVLGIMAFLHLLDRFYPHQAANVQLSRKQALTVAREYCNDLGLETAMLDHSVLLEHDFEAFQYLQQQLGLATAQDWMRYRRHSGLDYMWTVQFYEDLPANAEQEVVTVGINGAGELSYFVHNIPASRAWPRPDNSHLDREEAFGVALDFLQEQEVDMTDFMEAQYSATVLSTRSDHDFLWNFDSELSGCRVVLRMRVSGDRVTRYRFQFVIPTESSLAMKRQAGQVFFLDSVVSVFVLFLVGLLSIFLFLKKYHEGEVEVRSGGLFFLILWGVFVLQATLRFQLNAAGTTLGELSRSGVALFIFILLVLIIRPLLSLFGFTAWSVGEALGRERFGRKFRSVDALINKRFFTLDYAKSALQGYLSSAILLGLLAVCQTVALERFGSVTTITGHQVVLPATLPMFVPLLIAIWTAVLAEFLFRLFANLWLFQQSHSKMLAVLVAAFCFSFYAPGFWDVHLSLLPVMHQLVVFFIAGTFLGLLFWRYDLLTVIFASFVTMGVTHTLPLLTSHAASLRLAGIGALALLASPLVLMILGFIYRERFVQKVERIPAHIRRITERVRMSRELEIARQVQMRLLPKESPQLEGFEIKGGCIPAQEVGGDYYDFIDLSRNKLGVTIGDVSGKGVPAAIYMTLTKGIVQSHQDGLTPREILSRVNGMLYRAIDKESFVSLYYAILDTKNSTVHFARAGHNPLIYYNARSGECQRLEPAGIALGLEEGRRFDDVIREDKLKMASGDILAFYTDGFSEAMNAERQEYGEDRLEAMIAAHHHESAEALYQIVLADVQHFVDKAPQHDDMTLVLIKMK